MVKIQVVHSFPDQGHTVVDVLKPISDPCFHQLSQELDLKVYNSVGQREQAAHGIRKCGAFLSGYTIIIPFIISSI